MAALREGRALVTRQLIGVLVSAAVIGALVVLYLLRTGPANPVPVLLLGVLVSTFVGGLVPGIVATALVVTYAAVSFWLPGHPWRYDSAHVVRLWALVLLAPAIALLVGWLHHVAEQGERRRRAVQAAFDLVANHIEDFVVRRKLSGEILEANASFARFLGVEPERLVGVRIQEMQRYGVEGVGEEFVRRVRESLQHGEPAITRVTMTDARGRRREMEFTYSALDAAGETGEVLTVGRDVTAFVEREDLLRRENSRLLELSEAAHGLFLTFDAATLVERLRAGVASLAAGTARLYAPLSDGTLVETRDLTARPDGEPADAFAARVRDEDEVQADAAMSRVAYPVAGAGGGVAYVVDVSASPGGRVAPEDDAVLRLFAQYFAVAAHNALLYQELEHQRTSIIELNALKSDLIAMLAHDFRGPLSVISGNAELVADDPATPQSVRASMEDMVEAAMRLGRLAEQTLALARAEQNELQIHPEPTNVADLMEEVVAGFRPRRTVHLTVRDPDAVCELDAERMRQVFDNIISNAIKYSPGGEPVEVDVHREGEMVAVEVRDLGIGIPEGDLPRLFGRFARASNARARGLSGTGFGLYLAKKFVDLHGGAIVLASEEGAGSTFTVRLPVSRGGVREVGARIVLVADGDADSREFLGHVLRSQGFAVREAADARAAVEHLLRDPCAVAVVDENLPGLEGQALRAQLVEACRQGPKLVSLGGFGSSGLPESAVRVTKPFLLKDLFAAVERSGTR